MVDQKTVLFTAVKNEAPFIIEWIAYHRAIGFDQIIVCSNDCDDGTEEILEALAKNNEIDHISHKVKVGVSPQMQAARMVEKAKLIKDGDWVIWLDSDEFLNVRTGAHDVHSLVAALDGKKGMLINWRLFGDSGQIPFTGHLISKNFTMCTKRRAEANMPVKTFFQQGNGVLGFQEKGVHRPKIDADAKLQNTDFVNGKGVPLLESYAKHSKWLRGEDLGHDSRVQLEEVGFGLAQINHYFNRTPEMFWLKQLRGRGWVVKPQDGQNDRHTAKNYAEINHNDVSDPSILFWESETSAQTARLLKCKGVSPAVKKAQKIVAEKLKGFSKSDFANELLTVPDFKLTLPAEPAALVKEEYPKATSILEYGSGGSTFIAAANPDCHVVAVESDWNWAATIRKALLKKDLHKNVVIHWANIGPTKGWGRPKTNSNWHDYHKYALEAWDRPDFKHPDLVLIDGRFRIGCFLACLFKCTQPVRILWDDYLDRDDYNVVEKYVKPTKYAGRMAVFDVEPSTIGRENIAEIVAQFSMSE